MPDRIRLTCTTKTHRNEPWNRIARIGGVFDGGTRWTLTEDQAIERLERGAYAFFVHLGDDTADVIVGSHSGRKYLKTDGDGDHPDSLLSLPECG
jgi:hypothetical protein